MLGEHCGLVLEFPGVGGSIVETASDPWLSTVVPESPDVDLGPTLAALARAPVAVFACGARQANEATAKTSATHKSSAKSKSNTHAKAHANTHATHKSSAKPAKSSKT